MITLAGAAAAPDRAEAPAAPTPRIAPGPDAPGTDAPGSDAPGSDAPADPATLPEAGDVVTAFLRVERWLLAFDPPDPDSEAAGIPIRGSTGVCVIIRLRGRVLGTGTDVVGSPGMVRRAAGRAMSEVLSQPAVQDLPEPEREKLGEALTLELEASGALVPLPGRTFEEIAAQIEPGLDGLAARRGETLALRFPAELRATGTAGQTDRTLPALAVELGVPAREPGDLAAAFGVRFYRFRTIHLAQRAPGRRPRETFRGQTLVTREEVDESRIRALANGLENHIITAIWPHDEPLGVMGDYHGVTDRYVPLIAPPLEQALIALALARYAEVPQLRTTTADRMRMAASSILGDLAQSAEGEADPLADPASSAAIVLAGTTLPGPRDDAAVAQLELDAARGVTDAVAALPPSGAPPAESPHTLALIAAAAARLLDRQQPGVDAPGARRAIDAAWTSVPAHEQVTLLPWIGWAESDYAHAAGAPLANADRLRTLREVLERARIGPAGQPGPSDLRGGFALGSARTAVDAQTARPAAYLATMLRTPALTTEAEQTREVARHLDTMRFLIQLSVDDSLLWAVRGPQRAKGGVRADTWSLDQPLAAQALALLAASETLISLDALRGEPPAVEGVGGVGPGGAGG